MFKTNELNDAGKFKLAALVKQFEDMAAIVETIVTSASERKYILRRLQEAFLITKVGLENAKAYTKEVE